MGADATPSAVRSSIRKLSPLLINQIAAGEVIDRPASVVKELVENAIDAGARRVSVDLERGGIDLIRVRDDGHGIAPDELELAVSPHATSKIAEAEDLDRIGTMGFRGEALASIASVSRLNIVTATGEDGATEISIEGDRVVGPRPAARSRGTTIECKNLFFNTPARRKFLRTPGTEQARCLDWVRDLAIAHPLIGFSVTCDGARRLDVAPDHGARQRAIELLGRELSDQLLEVSADRFDDARGMLLWGLVGLPSIARANVNAQHVFLNGRMIRDRTIQHAIREAYRGLIEPGRYPTAVLMLEMSPQAVDVNVHPAKLEVRFRDQSMVHQVVLRAIREALQREDLTPSAVAKSPHLGAETQPRASFVEPSSCSRSASEGRLSFDAIRDAVAEEPLPTAPMPRPRQAQRVLQVHRSYLITEDETGVVIIDQHALHERVMFERLLERMTSGSLERQRLLTPIPVEAGLELIERLDELRPMLDRLGIEIEALGPRTIGAHSFPSLLFERGVEPGPFMRDLFAKFEQDGVAPGGEEALHEVLDMMACKSAVKAGDSLTEGEIAELVEMRETVERSGSCPHGRSTSVRLSMKELERLFDRR